jgi:hypothetical protein
MSPMAVYFLTDTPNSLLTKFDKRIDQEDAKGKITTWERSKDGRYTHKSDEWRRKAWFRPSIEQGRLTFNILSPANETLKITVYGYYHGHLIETFLNHFDKDFTATQAGALATIGDRCSSED